eukprot:Gb_27255 [translate_table: standard]
MYKTTPELSVEDLGELVGLTMGAGKLMLWCFIFIFMDLQVYAWKLPGVVGNAWNGEPGRSIAIGSSCIWDKFIFLATGRPENYMEMLLECLRNPGRMLGIITVGRKIWLEFDGHVTTALFEQIQTLKVTAKIDEETTAAMGDDEQQNGYEQRHFWCGDDEVQTAPLKTSENRGLWRI